MRTATTTAWLALAACSPGDANDTAPALAPVDRAACLVDPGCDYLFSVGHRGVIRFAPENTIAGFQLAEAMGLDGVEVDVRPTADEVLVAMHDSTVDRTTNGTGDVEAMTLAELSALTVTSEFPDIPDQPVPTFAEVLAALDEDTLVNVDAKTSRWDLIARAIEDAGATDRVWVQTDDLAESLEVVAGWPQLILMPDAETVEDVEALAAVDPALVEFPNTLLDAAPFEACHAAGYKPSQDALGPGDLGALADASGGGDGALAYDSLVDRGAVILQSDVPELLVPYLEARNAERGWAPAPR